MTRNGMKSTHALDKVSCKGETVVYRCIVVGCSLKYKTFVGLKRHLAKYDHEFYGMTALDDDNSRLSALREFMKRQGHDGRSSTPARSKKKGTQGKSVVDIKEILRCEDRVVAEVFRMAFYDGITRVKGEDDLGGFFCRIPGCGKSFKSLLAYKYHCTTFAHSLRCLVGEYDKENNVGACLEGFVVRFLQAFEVKNEFEVSGITHYMFSTPDTYMNIKFNIKKVGKAKGRIRGPIEDLCVLRDGEEEGPSQTSSEFRGRVATISLGGKEYSVENTLSKDNMHVRNLNSFVSCCVFVPSKKDVFIFVGMKQTTQPDKLFEFKGGESLIVVLGRRLDIIHEIRLDFGFVRKMEVSHSDGVFNVIALFNDGCLRSFKFKHTVFDVYDYDLVDIIEFCHAPIAGITIVTDGFRIHKLEDKNMALSTTAFEFPVISLAIKDLKDDAHTTIKAEYPFCPILFYADTNGRVMCCDTEFRNEEALYKFTGNTGVQYITEVDFVVLTDSYDLVTRYIHFKVAKNTRGLFNGGSTCTSYTEGVLYSGAFDGSVVKCALRRKKLKAAPVFRCTRAGNVFCVHTPETDLAVADTGGKSDFDYTVCVVGVHSDTECVFVVYRNGLIFSRKK